MFLHEFLLEMKHPYDWFNLLVGFPKRTGYLIPCSDRTIGMIFPYHRILSQKPLSRYAKRNSLVLLEVLSGGDSTPSPRSFFSLKNMYMNMDPLQQCFSIYLLHLQVSLQGVHWEWIQNSK